LLCCFRRRYCIYRSSCGWEQDWWEGTFDSHTRYKEAGLTALKHKVIKWTRVACMAVATVAALIAMIMPAVANAKAPSKSDTIQTWTCHWKGAVGAPQNFGPLCRESVCCYLFLPCIASLLSRLNSSRSSQFPLIMLTDTTTSNSRPMLPFHCSSFTFCCWSRASRTLLLYHNPSRHTMRSWSLLPKVSISPPLARTTVRESSKNIGNQSYRSEKNLDCEKRRNEGIVNTA